MQLNGAVNPNLFWAENGCFLPGQSGREFSVLPTHSLGPHVSPGCATPPPRLLGQGESNPEIKLGLPGTGQQKAKQEASLSTQGSGGRPRGAPRAPFVGPEMKLRPCLELHTFFEATPCILMLLPLETFRLIFLLQNHLSSPVPTMMLYKNKANSFFWWFFFSIFLLCEYC